MPKDKPPPIKILCRVCNRVLGVPKKDFKENRYYFCPFPCFYVYEKVAKGWPTTRH